MSSYSTADRSLAWPEAPAKPHAAVFPALCQLLAASGPSSISQLLSSHALAVPLGKLQKPRMQTQVVALVQSLCMAQWPQQTCFCPTTTTHCYLAWGSSGALILHPVFSLMAETLCKTKEKQQRRLLLSFFQLQVAIPFGLY